MSGNWFPLGDGLMRDVAQVLPSYWLVQASHVSLGDGSWTATGWLVVGAWAAVLTMVSALVHRRDTQRV